ncbi:DUF3311 domain-containing protein [Streptomyces bathyalis]|uniref:DUF3311 domain-containing protein n=1 Tax=Streptomyces bathyalis TaxID=2710756 RepID=A0A7T1TC28_9ACTN|nr:DUF3311 domain-containing protein [Streptomyces bathyalis]QPP10159.1 DUF3311 domain-containing protein [Streptomyces bathyalis]
MSDSLSDAEQVGAGRPARLPFRALPAANRRRRSLWLLLVPGVLYCAAPVVANSIEPRILGVPFLLAWIIMASVVSPPIIWVAARLDPAYRSDALEPIPADDVPGAVADGADGDGPAAGGLRGTAGGAA